MSNLLSFTLGVSKEYLIINANEELDDKKNKSIQNLIKRRLDGESISNITGSANSMAENLLSIAMFWTGPIQS